MPAARHLAPSVVFLLSQAVALTLPSLPASGQAAVAAPAQGVAAMGNAPATAPATQPGGPTTQNTSQVYVDDSFAALEKIHNGTRLLQQNQVPQGLTTYQGVIDSDGSKVIMLSPDLYTSLTEHVQQLLLALSPDRLGAYEQLVGFDAKKQVDAAVAAHDEQALRIACDRYFPSAAAFDGSMMLADRDFEQGHLFQAAQLWQKLLKHPSAKSGANATANRAQLLFRAALALHLAGSDTEANALSAKLKSESPDTHGTISGQDVVLAEKLADLFKLPVLTSLMPPTATWPTFQGDNSRDLLITSNAALGTQLWSSPVMDPRLVARLANQSQNQAALMRRRFGAPQRNQMQPNLSTFPTFADGRLFIHNGQQIAAFSAFAGTPLWAFPPNPSPTNDNFMYGNLRPTSHYSVTIANGTAFGVIPKGEPVYRGNDNDTSTSLSDLVACDVRSGEARWSVPATSVSTGTAGNIAFVGSPLVIGDRVYIAMRKTGQASFGQDYIACLDANTGKSIWCTYVCSSSIGNYGGGFMSFAAIPILSAANGEIYLSTGRGADCACDAASGRIDWLHVTEIAHATSNVNDFSTRDVVAGWKCNPPLVIGDLLLTCDGGSSKAVCHLYNRWDGTLYNTLKPTDFQLESIDILAGVSGNRAFFTGSAIVAIDFDPAHPETAPKVAWSMPLPKGMEAGLAMGRPVLAKNIFYVPFEKGLLSIDPATGKQIAFETWPRDVQNQPGEGGNVIFTNEQIVVLNDKTLAGYSRWETARDNRLAKIAAHPEDPAAYLALAEIAYRTGHDDLAHENMTKAVTLATAGNSAANADVLNSLYETNITFARQLLDGPTPDPTAKPDPKNFDAARYYFNQAKASARTPEQQAQWRLTLSRLSLAEGKPQEAASLYNDVLADDGLRAAPFNDTDGISPAGAIAERRFRDLVTKSGADIYARFEDAAKAQLAQARQSHDVDAFQQVVDRFPNSAASRDAAKDLVAVCRDHQLWGRELAALRWLLSHATDTDLPQVAADMATSHLALHRPAAALAWSERGNRRFKDFTWNDPATQQPVTFAKFSDQIRSQNPFIDGRLPTLPPASPDSRGRPNGPPAMDDDSFSKPVCSGMLLTPVEQSPTVRRPDLFFILKDGAIHIYNSATNKDLTASHPITLPNNANVLLLGSVGDISLFLQSDAVIAVNTRSLNIAYQFTISDAVNPGSNDAAKNKVAAAPGPAPAVVGAVLINGNVRMIGGGIARNGGRVRNVMNGNGGGYDDTVVNPPDPEVARQFAFSTLDHATFLSANIVGKKLVLSAGTNLSAFDAQTGKPLWKDPNRGDGNGALLVKIPLSTETVVAGNDDVLTAELSLPDNQTRTLVIDATTGAIRRDINLRDEDVQWSTLSDDGIYYILSDQAVTAYDLNSNQTEPLWRRTDIQARCGYSAQLTLDGLFFTNNNNEVIALAPDTGERCWPDANSAALRLNIPVPQTDNGLRTSIAGDMLIFQSPQGISSYYTYPPTPGDEPIAWIGSINPGQIPPLLSFQKSDPYIVLLASGPMPGSSRSVRLLFINQKGGRIRLMKTLSNFDASADGDGPVITRWQLVDNGVLIESNGNVYFYHGKQS